MARSLSDRALAREVSTSASRKSAQVTSLTGVATRNKVVEKNCRVSCSPGRQLSVTAKCQVQST